MSTPRFDVVVIGAGSSGSAAALHCARRGLEVLCIDRRPLERAGARWVNGIPAWIFKAAQLSQPRRPELLGEPSPMHMVAGYGPERIVVENHDLLEIDMRCLVRRLQREGSASGVRFMGEVDVNGFDGEVLETSMGEIHACWVVDASGLGGAGLIELPRIEREDICAAAQEVRRIDDRKRAQQFFADHGVPWGQTLCFTGIAGGYSVLNLKGSAENLHILTGSIPGLGHRSGLGLLREFLSQNDWVGEQIFGGACPIPLRRPFDQLGQGRVAVVGDAACQVFSAHGSGVGAGLLAARELAEALSRGEGVLGYTLRWHRRYGGLFASYDLFRRFSSALSVHQVARMMNSGLLDGEVAAVGLSQRAPSPRSLGRLRGRALTQTPDLLIAMGSVVARMAMASLIYRQYPRNVSRHPAWSRRVAALFEMDSDQSPG
ncbi:MAG: NAD(P)/FAD-dependent oxidoreductase [Bradymonadaceae bacterium]